jgi:radical SAM superfamily enzyme YgiQ (UPF0313 family)
MPFRRILLVKPSGRSGLGFLVDQIPIGLEYIAAHIEGVVEEVHIVDMELEEESFQHLMDVYRPNLVGITMSATEHHEGLRLAKIAKNRDVVTIVGGYHATGVPDLLLNHPQIDMVVRGEGELIMRDIVEKECPEGVLGVSYQKDGRIIHNEDMPLVKDLDSLHFPARHLRKYSYKADDRKTGYDVLLTSRGCYGRCTFCCEPSMSRGRLRCRSPENVVEEVLEISRYNKGKPTHVFIADPMFMGNPSRVGRICDLLQEHDLNMIFNALVRTDNMARNPAIVKKMCEAGIQYFEMGIESPNYRDLESTKKGITNRIQREAVQNIRKYGGNAGGTFVVGLPDQTEEEIKRFPIYAKEIGLMSAAFGIVTPFPGTEFYDELNSKGLIFETNWDNFDEMHSVYKTKHLSKEKIEELATYCMAKFWNIDTFIDREKVILRKTKKKKHLVDFILERAIELRFIGDAGKSLKKDTFNHYMKKFIDAYPDPCVEDYTRKVGVHNVLEMSNFLRILGSQIIQCSLGLDDDRTSFIMETTNNKVEYIRVIQNRQDHSTINFNIDLKLMSELNQESKIKMVQKSATRILHEGGIKRLWNTMRLFLAISTEVLTWKLTKNHKID